VLQQQVACRLTAAGVRDDRVTMPAGDAFGRAQLSRQLGSLGPQVLAPALLLSPAC